MRLCVAFVTIFLVFPAYTKQRSTPQDDHYIAAVVEYAINSNAEQNSVRYAELIAQAAQQSADVIVFPELTLTNNSVSIPVPLYGILKEYPIPALQPLLYDDLLVSMSEAARQHEIYVVVNVQEIMDCTTNTTGEECPEAKRYLFNTNVVIDRAGAVIDRYRKINLFGEYTRTPALHPDLGIFTTDFGVTFGHFICFDLVFQVPAVQVVQKHQITDVIFSTMWFSELPYLTAVQFQESYAYSMNVNFLAAGANRPQVGSAGSGIYSGKAGALISIMPGVSTTRLLVAKVPKVPGQVTEPVPGPIYDNPSDHDGLRLITDPSLPAHVSRLLVDGAQEFVIVDKDVSCTFRVKLNHASGDQTPRYRALVQDGTHTYLKREVGVAACLLVACKDDHFNTCSYRFDQKTTKSGIEELEIEMKTYRHQYNQTLKCDDIVYFSVSFQANKFPLSPKNVTYIDADPDGNIYNQQEEMNLLNVISKNDAAKLQNGGADSRNGGAEPQNGGREHVLFKITQPQDGLMAFGIWGRLFARDVDHSKNVSEEDIRRFNSFVDTVYND